MSEPKYDYSDYEDLPPQMGHNLLAALTDLADKMEAVEALELSLEQQLDEVKQNRRRISEQEIPKLLEGLQATITLPDGREVIVEKQVHASISGKKAGPAIQYLDKNGHSDIIKRQFVIAFGKADDKWADKFERDLAKRKKPLNVKRQKSVHPQTLLAFVREQLAEGTDIPKDVFGIFHRQVAKIK